MQAAVEKEVHPVALARNFNFRLFIKKKTAIKTCSFCEHEYNIDEMIAMPCSDLFCTRCFKRYFKYVIQNETADKFNCPVCGQPDLNNSENTQDISMELFVAMKKCQICQRKSPMNEMVAMPCGDLFCTQCFKLYFHYVIQNENADKFNCPICRQPDLNNSDNTQDISMGLFLAMIEVHLDRNDYELCQRKLTDFCLLKKETERVQPQLCNICMDEYARDEMIAMPACQHSLCKGCFKQAFECTIRGKSVKHFVCQECNEPDLTNNDPANAVILQIFVELVKKNLGKPDYEMCQQKLTDFNLSQEKGFLWCPHENCGSGFINDWRGRANVECPNCHKQMCCLCKKKWEDQHEGITCEQFTQWKTDNDPEAQKAGLAAILKANGIQCPGCKFRYDLARGGCMHFRCTQCPREFCSGCYGSFVKVCGQGYCKKHNLGLHAHHPRDCLFHLRDFSVKELQQLLQANNMEFHTEPPAAQVVAAKEKKENAEAVPTEVQAPVAAVAEGEGEEVKEKPVHVVDGEEIELVCQVMLQKETPNGLIDEECLTGAPQGMAGLCEVHYKEYLVDKINKSKVDPVELYSLNQLKLILTRVEIEVPGQDNGESKDDYRRRLIKLIKERLPLERNESEATGI